ncbi:MAG: hypothetical protein EZS28_020145 [Streblomastix strix]|uniref:Uncharacterized protein n=1 Tax=Streblomastix strix TaxID=222440 RepID=A0A5J4VP67_9EUKA|nr:MAG: hypothetical protein EZS28_020145 [Streblomastix strix]
MIWNDDDELFEQNEADEEDDEGIKEYGEETNDNNSEEQVKEQYKEVEKLNDYQQKIQSSPQSPKNQIFDNNIVQGIYIQAYSSSPDIYKQSQQQQIQTLPERESLLPVRQDDNEQQYKHRKTKTSSESSPFRQYSAVPLVQTQNTKKRRNQLITDPSFDDKKSKFDDEEEQEDYFQVAYGRELSIGDQAEFRALDEGDQYQNNNESAPQLQIQFQRSSSTSSELISDRLKFKDNGGTPFKRKRSSSITSIPNHSQSSNDSQYNSNQYIQSSQGFTDTLISTKSYLWKGANISPKQNNSPIKNNNNTNFQSYDEFIQILDPALVDKLSNKQPLSTQSLQAQQQQQLPNYNQYRKLLQQANYLGQQSERGTLQSTYSHTSTVTIGGEKDSSSSSSSSVSSEPDYADFKDEDEKTFNSVLTGIRSENVKVVMASGQPKYLNQTYQQTNQFTNHISPPLSCSASLTSLQLDDTQGSQSLKKYNKQRRQPISVQVDISVPVDPIPKISSSLSKLQKKDNQISRDKLHKQLNDSYQVLQNTFGNKNINKDVKTGAKTNNQIFTPDDNENMW